MNTIVQITLSAILLFTANIASSQELIISLQSSNETLYEGCTDSLVFSLNEPAANELNFSLIFSGTSIRGIDYNIPTLINDTITFDSSENRVVHEILFVDDGVTEFIENIEITYRQVEDTRITGKQKFSAVDNFSISIKDVGDTIFVCDGEQVFTLEATEAARYEWASDFGMNFNEDSSSVEITTDDDGYIYLTGVTGECTSKDSVYVEYYADEEFAYITLDREYLCLDDEKTIDVNIRPFDAIVVWSPDVSISDVNSSNPIFSPTVTTEYYLDVTTEHCRYFDTVVVQVDSLPSVGLVSLPPPNPNCGKYCQGEVIKLTSDEIIRNELYPDIKYEWTPKGDLKDGIDSLQSALITTSETRTYTRINTNNECMDEDTIRIEVVVPDVPIMNDTTVCFEKPVDITIDATDLTDIEWTPKEGLSCSDCPNPTAIVGKTTTFTVKATKENCCPVETSITITIRIPPIDMAPAITCPNVDLQSNLNLDGRYTDPEWISNTEYLSCDNCLDPIVNIPASTQFVLQAINEENCLSQGIYNVAVYPPVTTTITYMPQGSVPQGARIDFEVETDPVQENASFTWFYNGSEVPGNNSINEIRILKEGEENEIKVTYIDDNGCMQSAIIFVTGIKPVVEMPNAFTPNNDDVNDLFRPILKNAEFVPEFVQDFRISNRFGKVIYKFEDNENGWDGTLPNGELAPPEVYLYYVELLYPDGTEEFKKGDVTLIR